MTCFRTTANECDEVSQAKDRGDHKVASSGKQVNTCVQIFPLFFWQAVDQPAAAHPTGVSKEHCEAHKMAQAKDGVPDLVPIDVRRDFLFKFLLIQAFPILAHHEYFHYVHQTGDHTCYEQHQNYCLKCATHVGNTT